MEENKGFKMKGASLYGKLNLNRGGQSNMADGREKSSALQMHKPGHKEEDKKVEKKVEKKEGEHTQYEHPTYYNNDGTVNKGGSTGDFDEGELSTVKKDQNGRRYVERSDGKILFLDNPKEKKMSGDVIKRF